MEALKELFGDGQLSYAEFEKAVKGKGIELARSVRPGLRL